jgi:hypothetical protein
VLGGLQERLDFSGVPGKSRRKMSVTRITFEEWAGAKKPRHGT